MTQSDSQDTLYSSQKHARVIKTIAQLLLFLPVILVISLTAVLRNLVCGKPVCAQLPENERKTVLVSGAKMSKSLYLVRWLGEAGHRVILFETPKYWCSGSRFSRYVEAFYTVTDFREDNGKKYRADILEIARKHKVDWWIPACSPASENMDSLVADDLRRELNAKVLHLSSDKLDTYANKHKFCELVGKMGLDTPRTFICSSDQDAINVNEQLRKEASPEQTFVLKNLNYDAIHRLDLFRMPCSDEELRRYLTKIREDGNGISDKEQWSVQEFIPGQEYTAMAIVKSGIPVMLTMSLSSASHFNYEHIDVPCIRKWHQEFFSKQTDINGLFTTDFIISERDGKPYAFETNPRLGSLSSLLLPVKNVVDVIFKPVDTGKSLESQLTMPEEGSGFETYILMNEIFKLIEPTYYSEPYTGFGDICARVCNFFKLVARAQDPLCDGADIMPFLMFNYFQVPNLLIDTLMGGYQWKKVDFQIGKVVQMGGD